MSSGRGGTAPTTSAFRFRVLFGSNGSSDGDDIDLSYVYMLTFRRVIIMANGTIAFDTLSTSGQITGTAKSVDTDYVVSGSSKLWSVNFTLASSSGQ